jgi:hypothetical protein
MTVFAQETYDGAYSVYAAHDDGAASYLYVLAGVPSKPGDTLSLADAWALTTQWALIVRDQAWDFASESPTAAAKGLSLAAQSSGALVLAWRADPSSAAAWWWPPMGATPEYQTVICPPGGGNRQVLRDATIAFGNVMLTITGAAEVTLGGDAFLHIARTGTQFSIGRADVRIGLSTYDNADFLTSAAGGVAAGSLRTAGASWSPKNVFLLGQDSNQFRVNNVDPPEVRFWWGQGASQRLRLPMFTPVDVMAPRIAVDFALNPALPFDPTATRFDVSAATQGCFTSTASLMTVDGTGLGLTPVSGVGFHLAPGFVSGQNRVYLAPYGRFSLVMPQGVNGPVRLMPGLSGLEYIKAAGGDFLDLVPAQPAFGAPASPDGSQPPRLTSLCTTAWMKLTPSGAPNRPYYAQPLSSVFYASVDGKSLPRAADAKVSDLTGNEKSYPLAPYANIFLPSTSPQPPADQTTAFEHTFLAGIRGATLGSQTQPVFSVDGTVLTQKGATPRGLFAEIGPTSSPKAGLRSADANTPAGQWRRLYLAKGVSEMVTLEPTAGGVVDPVIGNAFLQPDLFLVYNNWAGYPIGVAGELDVGGFSFDWAPLDKSPSTMLIAKFNSKISLRDLFALPQRWRDSDKLVTKVSDAQAVFNAAMKTAEDSKKANLTLFDDFLDRIAGDPNWTGLVVFQAPVDGNAMPPTLQILIAGMNQPLRAHHIAVDVTALSSEGGVPQDVGPSSVAGVISYDAPAQAAPAGDYGFYTQSLKVGIFGSAVTSFNAEVGITANTLFGRAVALRPLTGDPTLANTFLLKGIYHVIATVPTVTFQLPAARVFDFVVDPGAGGGTISRVIERFEIDSAGIMPQATTTSGDDTIHLTQITLSGQLWFAVNPFNAPVDLFSYGLEDGAGLALNNFGLEMTFVLDKNGQRENPPTFEVDYSRLAVADTFRSLRPGGMVGGLPFKLKGILANDEGLDVTKLGGKPVQVLQIASQQTSKPHFALQFELIIGSLGELSGVHAGLTAEMRLGWGPLDTTPDADGALVTIQLPGASAGFSNFNIQGMLQMVFGEANLMQVQYTPK